MRTVVVRKALEVLLVMEVAEGQDEQVAGIMLCPPLHQWRHHKGVPMPFGCLQTLQHAELSIDYSLPIRLCGHEQESVKGYYMEPMACTATD